LPEIWDGTAILTFVLLVAAVVLVLGIERVARQTTRSG